MRVNRIGLKKMHYSGLQIPLLQASDGLEHGFTIEPITRYSAPSKVQQYLLWALTYCLRSLLVRICRRRLLINTSFKK